MGTIIGPWERTVTLEDNDSDMRMMVAADASGASIEIRDDGLSHRMVLDDRARRVLIEALGGTVLGA
jgi:hypothetical protein